MADAWFMAPASSTTSQPTCQRSSVLGVNIVRCSMDTDASLPASDPRPSKELKVARRFQRATPPISSAS